MRSQIILTTQIILATICQIQAHYPSCSTCCRPKIPHSHPRTALSQANRRGNPAASKHLHLNKAVQISLQA